MPVELEVFLPKQDGDVEFGGLKEEEEEEYVEQSQTVPRRKLTTVFLLCAVVAVIGFVAFRSNDTSNTEKTKATDELMQLSNFGNININGGGNTLLGDKNVQTNVVNGNQITKNVDQSVHNSMTQNVIGNNNKLEAQQKECEGSGNGGAGSTGSVCCKGPGGVCCAATAAAAKAGAASTSSSAQCTGGTSALPGMPQMGNYR